MTVRQPRLGWPAVVVLLVTALAPPAAASTGDLAAERIAVPGEATLEGMCRVVRFTATAAGDSASLTITGTTLVLELDTAWGNVSVPTFTVDRDNATRREEYRDATFEATAFRAEHDVFLADVPGRPAPRVHWTGSPGHLGPSPPGTVRQVDSNTEGHPLRSIDVGDTVSWKPAPGWTSLSATGDFYLSLWEVDGQAFNGTRSDPYTTGETADPPADGVPQPLPPAFAVGRVEDRVLHVFAFNATLQWRFRETDAPDAKDDSGLRGFHVTGASVDSPAPMLLSSAKGTLGGNGARMDVRAGDVRVDSGRLDDVRNVGYSLALRLTAPDDALALDGQPIVWPRPDPVAPPWLVVGAAGALALALVLAWRWSRPGLRRLERSIERGRYADVVARRGRVRVKARHAPQASVLHAVSLLALQRPDEAANFLEALPAGARPEPPTFSYLLATARAGQGRTAEARRLVRDCLEAAPEYLREVVANPSLLPFLQGSGRPRRRGGAEGAG